MASLAILVLTIGMGSQTFVHSAAAKGMPTHWLKSDGTVQEKYLKILHGTSDHTKYPKPHPHTDIIDPGHIKHK